jgi:hypothetical protein
MSTSLNSWRIDIEELNEEDREQIAADVVANFRKIASEALRVADELWPVVAEKLVSGNYDMDIEYCVKQTMRMGEDLLDDFERATKEIAKTGWLGTYVGTQSEG